jgi:hypothetical protein
LKRLSKETGFVYSGLFLFFCITSLFCFFSEGTYESGDSIQHFLISKYSFRHPHLFLDHWGKPFFTLISSPFSQFGFTGIAVFNTLCATLTGWAVYHICLELQIKNSCLAPLFALFTPIYYVVIISGLTEIFFGLILCLSVLLFIKRKCVQGSILISFLPFVRSEGYLLLPLFALILLNQRRWKEIFLLAAGSIIYSVVGYFYYHDILWLAHQNPYKGAKDIYGSGPLFWFISENEFLLGIPLVVLFLLGLISYSFKKNHRSIEEKILIIGCFAIYFVAHSIFWWKGLFGSLGLIRVIAAVTPLSAIIALQGLQLIMDLIKNSIAQKIFTITVMALVVWIPFKQHQFPRPLDHKDALVKEAAQWIKDEGLDDRRTFYLYPYLSLFLDKDPFDNTQLAGLWSRNLETIKKGDLVFYETFFCPNEGRLPLEILVKDPNLQLLNHFSLKDASPSSFDIYVFQRMK